MKRAIVILAAAFCGWVFAISVPSARHLDPALQLASKVSLAWIGFYCIYNSPEEEAPFNPAPRSGGRTVAGKSALVEADGRGVIRRGYSSPSRRAPRGIRRLDPRSCTRSARGQFDDVFTILGL
jgi:hypothetical protein